MTPISPRPVTGPGDDLLPAYLSNGVIGLRVRDVPLRPGVAVISGMEGEHPTARVASVPTVPYPLAGDLRIDSFTLSHHSGRIHAIEQRYDFSCAELHSRFRVAGDGIDATVEVVTFCSRSLPAVCAQEITVTPTHDATLALSVGVDPAGVAGTWLDRSTKVPDSDGDDVDGLLLWESLGALATCGEAYWSECTRRDADQSRSEATHAPLMTTYTADVRAGEALTVRQCTALVPSANHAQPHRQAVRLAAQSRNSGFERLRRENADAWGELWKARPVLIGGDEAWQALADAAFFYLHASTHPGSLSTHPFGLAQWYGYHYYYGHVMWDCDTFLAPALLLTNPEAAHAMLDFRIRCMEAARENARLNGYGGAQFPWEASPSRGEEAAPALGTAALYEHHVTADVAKLFADYAHATGDDVFYGTRAWPVLAAAAEWLTTRATQTDRGWEIHEAMGIAERKKPADNAAFVNMAASVALREAIACGERFGYDVPHSWRAMREGLVLPMRGDVILDHDGYRVDEEKASTPAALAGLFPAGYEVAESVRDETLRFYLDMADDYAGSPMLSALLGVWGALLGDRKRATYLFEEGYAKFASPRFNVVHEYRKDRFPEQPVSGPFLANMGGFLIALYQGLTGLRISGADPKAWCASPVVMPDAWDGIEVERLWVRGRAASLRAMHGDARASLEFV